MAHTNTQNRPREYRRIPGVLALLVALTLLAAACSSDDSSSASGDSTDATTATGATSATEAGSAADDPESPFCRTALDWQVHELTPVDQSDPAVLETYMSEYAAFATQSAEQAPESISDDAQLVADGITDDLLPLMERYGYDGARFEAEATDEEKALLDAPPPEVDAAQNRIHEYEALVCGAGQPPAADVDFTGAADSPYCQTSIDLDEAVGSVAENGFDPAEVEEVYTSDEVSQLFDDGADNAPAEIAEDVGAVNEFVRTEQLPLMESYGFDVRELLSTASAEERAVFQYTAPAIIDHFARTLAYDEQVCGIES